MWPVSNILEFPYITDIHPTKVDFDQRNDIMFLGGYAHLPNVDAVTFFVQKVWPRLLSRLPHQARFLIVGAAPSAEVKALADQRIIVTGMVPDLSPWFDQARVFVAPLRYGAGIKGKLIQSPCLWVALGGDVDCSRRNRPWRWQGSPHRRRSRGYRVCSREALQRSRHLAEGPGGRAALR